MLSAAYAAADLSVTLSVLLDCRSKGLATIDEVVGVLQARMPTGSPALPGSSAINLSAEPCPSIRPDGTPCPGVLGPVTNAAGLRIVGCRVCRYSEVR